jgi:erythromycin esterase-like protein
MLGEASHGTHEYYTWRTAISKRLIREKGFRFIAVEGDWPDCYKINRYIKGYPSAGADIRDVLKQFDRWPTWMWACWEIAALAEWLRDYNTPLRPQEKVGFYGLDVYSLWDSMKAMMDYLEKEDKIAARAVLHAIDCFEPFREDEHAYARHSLRDYNCSEQVVAMLRAIRIRAQHLDSDPEAAFNAEQNALIAVNAENYYRNMVGFDNETWNIRDRHMMETLDRLLRFHTQAYAGSNTPGSSIKSANTPDSSVKSANTPDSSIKSANTPGSSAKSSPAPGPGVQAYAASGPRAKAKALVWAHNTHVGDARATNMHAQKMVNIGQLAREQYGNENVYLVGFCGYAGTVIAGEGWGRPLQVMEVPKARRDSIEGLLHHQSSENRYMLSAEDAGKDLPTDRIRQRAIGVVYDPENELLGNYVPSLLPRRYDALIYLDQTIAVHPLHLAPHDEKMPETYPFGI